MILLTRFNRNPVVVNADQILFVEATPDTLVTLMNGDRLHVLEPVEDVVRRAMDYQRRVHFREAEDLVLETGEA